MKKDVTLSSNVIKEEKGTTISYKELQIRCNDILLKIKNNKLVECSAKWVENSYSKSIEKLFECHEALIQSLDSLLLNPIFYQHH